MAIADCRNAFALDDLSRRGQGKNLDIQIGFARSFLITGIWVRMCAPPYPQNMIFTVFIPDQSLRRCGLWGNDTRPGEQPAGDLQIQRRIDIDGTFVWHHHGGGIFRVDPVLRHRKSVQTA